MTLTISILIILTDIFIFAFLVICSFRGSVPQGLVLEIGETVQILEKCEGKCGPIKHINSDQLWKCCNYADSFFFRNLCETIINHIKYCY